MHTVELVYQYRHLLGKCQSGRGLDVEEIDALLELEAHFRVDRSDDTELFACRRAHTREPVELEATLRNKRLDDRVRVVEIGPGGMVCMSAPYLDEGDRLEVFFVSDNLTYRFRATVAWVQEDGEDYACGLQLEGTPLLVRRGPAKAEASTEDQSSTTPFERVAA